MMKVEKSEQLAVVTGISLMLMGLVLALLLEPLMSVLSSFLGASFFFIASAIIYYDFAKSRFTRMREREAERRRQELERVPSFM